MIHYLIVQMSYKNNCGRFYRDLTLKPSRPVSISHLRLKFILEEWITKQIRKAIQALRNVIKGLHAEVSNTSIMARYWALPRDLHAFL